jgi:hypothetical protein
VRAPVGEGDDFTRGGPVEDHRQVGDPSMEELLADLVGAGRHPPLLAGKGGGAAERQRLVA